MIETFRENEVRDSGIIFKSTFEQVKKLYAKDKELAGELAISAMELVLTGEISSDDFMIEVILENMKVINERNNIKRDKSIEAKSRARIENLKLMEIAEMLNNGVAQKVIANTLGESITTINYRVKVIREEYSYLLENPKNPKNPKNTKDVNVNVNVNDNDNVVCLSPSEPNWGGPQTPLEPKAQEEKFKF